MKKENSGYEAEAAWPGGFFAELSQRAFWADDERDLADACQAEPEGVWEENISTEMPDGSGDSEGDEGFVSTLTGLIQQEWKGTKRALCSRALLSESVFYKIQSGRRSPERDAVIALALAMGLEPEQARSLLSYLGYGLSEYIKRDYVILRCLEQQIDPARVNVVFAECGLRQLTVSG